MQGKEVGRDVVKNKKQKKQSIAFHWLSCCQERKGLSYCCRVWDFPLPLYDLLTLFHWGFCSFLFVCFLHFPLLIKIFLWKHLIKHEDFFWCQWLFVPRCQGGPFLCTVSHQREKADFKPTEVTFEYRGVAERTVRHFSSKVHMLPRSETLEIIWACHHQRFGDKLQQAWNGYFGKDVSSDVICFNSGKSWLSGHQMMCRSSQGLALSLSVSCESKSQFLVVWWHKGWFSSTW